MWKNIWTIIKREYLVRVKDKRFLILTLLLPFILAIFMFVVGKLATYQSDDTMNIAIIDDDNIMDKKLKDQGKMFFSFPTESLDQVINQDKFDAVVHIAHTDDFKKRTFPVTLYSDKALSFDRSFELEDIIADKIRDYKVEYFNLDEEQLDQLSTRVELRNKPRDSSKSDTVSSSGEFINSAFGLIIGYVIGFVMFMMIIFNGNMVFQSVMEEKTNRIVEVMISTVRPFELMIGKIIGTGAVGLSQLLVWAIFIPVLFLALQFFLGIDTQAMADNQSAEQLKAMGFTDMEEMIYRVQEQISAVNWYKVFFISIIYFLLGFVFYASMFAAAGALSGDDMQQASQMTLPITLPLVLSFYILMATVRTPDSSLAFWSSIVPFSSLLIMPSLSISDIPMWQIGLSLLVLLASTAGMIWFAARVYRIGILLYGKQIKIKDLFSHLSG